MQKTKGIRSCFKHRLSFTLKASFSNMLQPLGLFSCSRSCKSCSFSKLLSACCCRALCQWAATVAHDVLECYEYFCIRIVLRMFHFARVKGWLTCTRNSIGGLGRDVCCEIQSMPLLISNYLGSNTVVEYNFRTRLYKVLVTFHNKKLKQFR